jgi:hypothetical protein
MDINQWLQNTADAAAERAPLPDQRGFPAFLYPKDRPVVKPSAKRHGRRRGQSRDSSILELQESYAATSRSRRKAEQVQQDVDRGSSPDAPSDCRSSEAKTDCEGRGLYRRKARRKTRPDRFDAQPVRDATRGQDKRKRKRRAVKDPQDAIPAKKRGKEKRALAAVMDNFHTESIPRQRLTVRAHALRIHLRG